MKKIFSLTLLLMMLTLAGAFVVNSSLVQTSLAQTSLAQTDISKVQSTPCYMESSITFVNHSVLDTTNVQENIGYKNNKFGLYIYSVDDYIDLASDMVNTNGDWGYVLIPYNVKDYDESKWEKTFSRLSERHLIPIIQLWDIDPNDYEEQTKDSAKFLNSLEWPVKNRYISAYNEMNDERYWNGGLDPKGYALVLDATIDEFKKLNEDFFIINGAFNATAPNGDGYMDMVSYMDRMDRQVPGIFKKLDGWASHSYPQPAFTGHPANHGRGSIRTYEWELEILEYYFDVTNLPVFITETGWPHSEGEVNNGAYYNAETVASFYAQAFEQVWLPDERVVAVTPFTIIYDSPHDHFSFITKGGNPYPQYETLKNMEKVEGSPPLPYEFVEPSLICR